ncbi:Tetratricopeptide repeat (TPR)-like superfamily protein [Euphorbia peplus]|nr:Tetratricopeptide repeat (TPR)-like superfamily protein [Euphorbia peplus]
MYLRQVAAKLSRTRTTTPFLSRTTKHSYYYGSRIINQKKDSYLWTILAGQAAIMLGIYANPAFAHASTESSTATELGGGDSVGLRKVEDGSIISNEHTIKWRVFTDNGREYFLKGKLDEAEMFFLSALKEAKEGFGNRDPHVASACNNLAELHRVRKAFDKAEPLYLEAINILEESFGPEDIRVGAACHNLGQFYLVRRKLEEAQKCYERALKIKRRVLGLGHTDYADTMYHLGTVLNLQGKEKDAEALIEESIQILQEAGQGESVMCIRRLRYLSQMYLRSNRLPEAENVQRRILHAMELSKGWDSMDTVTAAERLAQTLQAVGSLKEARELLERCLDTQKKILPEDHFKIGASMLQIARVAMLNANLLRKSQISEATAELDNAKDLLYSSVRIAQQVLNKLRKQKSSRKKNGASEEFRTEGHAALILLLQSLDTLGHLAITKQELQDSTEEHLSHIEAEDALLQCIAAYKEFKTVEIISQSPEVKSAYLSCLKRLSSLIGDNATKERELSGKVSLQEEIKHIESEISSFRKGGFLSLPRFSTTYLNS